VIEGYMILSLPVLLGNTIRSHDSYVIIW